MNISHAFCCWICSYSTVAMADMEDTTPTGQPTVSREKVGWPVFDKYLCSWSVSDGTLPHSHIRQSGDVSQAIAVRRWHASNHR